MRWVQYNRLELVNSAFNSPSSSTTWSTSWMHFVISWRNVRILLIAYAYFDCFHFGPPSILRFSRARSFFHRISRNERNLLLMLVIVRLMRGHRQFLSSGSTSLIFSLHLSSHADTISCISDNTFFSVFNNICLSCNVGEDSQPNKSTSPCDLPNPTHIFFPSKHIFADGASLPVKWVDLSMLLQMTPGDRHSLAPDFCCSATRTAFDGTAKLISVDSGVRDLLDWLSYSPPRPLNPPINLINLDLNSLRPSVQNCLTLGEYLIACILFLLWNRTISMNNW